jgi:hypothetical protein
MTAGPAGPNLIIRPHDERMMTVIVPYHTGHLFLLPVAGILRSKFYSIILNP